MIFQHAWTFQGFPGGSDGGESSCNVGNLGSIPGLGRSPGEGNGNPVLEKTLESPLDCKEIKPLNPKGDQL